jgi:uncharacterized protein YecE (DUF72 family)
VSAVSNAAPQLFVGCPMWAHRPWFGRSLPAVPRPGHELAVYSAALNAVEGNTTFYASPSPDTVARWATLVAPDFRFVFKAPRVVTHERRLRDVGGPLAEFLALIEPLAPNVGSVTLQLPATFAPADLPVLGAVVGGLSREWHWSVEVRHPGFFEGDACAALDDLLHRHAVERVVFDSRTLFAAAPTSDAEREAWDRKPRVPVLTDALTDRPIVRYIGRDDTDATVAGWQDWLPVVAAWLEEGRTPLFFVHTPDNLDSPTLARAFHAEVGLLEPSLQPLPELGAGDGVVEQPSLF